MLTLSSSFTRSLPSLPLLLPFTRWLRLAYIAALSILIVTFFWIIQLCMTLSLHMRPAKAGAYGAHEYGELIIERVEGSFSNVMGFPVERLRATFEKLGILSDLVS